MSSTDFNLTLSGQISIPNPTNFRVVSVGLGAIVTGVEIAKLGNGATILDIQTSGRTVTVKYRGRGLVGKFFNVPCTLRVHWDPIITPENARGIEDAYQKKETVSFSQEEPYKIVSFNDQVVGYEITDCQGLDLSKCHLWQINGNKLVFAGDFDGSSAESARIEASISLEKI